MMGLGRFKGRAVCFALCVVGLSLGSIGCQTESEPTAKKAAAPTAASSAKKPLGSDTFCPVICQRTRELRCPARAHCEEVCRLAFADMVCLDELRPAMECALSQPISAWNCSNDGFGAVADGPCDREQAAYDACLAKTR
jgi:hypothetical protein